MAVKKHHTLSRIVKNRSGQSILEVLFVLPMLFLFVGVLYRISMAVQMGINNTQYARSQVYVLAANSPEYPRLEMRWSSTLFAAMNQDRMVLGVSDVSVIDSNTRTDTSTLDPVPQTQKIARSGTEIKGSEERGEQKMRNTIRVRNTSGICTQLNSVGGKQVMDSDGITSILSKRWPFGFKEACQYAGFGGTAVDAEN
jgi:Tfp pilus assembly protein PilV